VSCFAGGSFFSGGSLFSVSWERESRYRRGVWVEGFSATGRRVPEWFSVTGEGFSATSRRVEGLEGFALPVEGFPDRGRTNRRAPGLHQAHPGQMRTPTSHTCAAVPGRARI